MILYRCSESVIDLIVDNKTQLKQTLQGVDFVQCNITLDDHFDFKIGDYVYWNSKRYTIFKQPSVKKDKNNKFDYNFDLESDQYRLMDALYMFDGQTDFALMGDLQKFAVLIITNLNRLSGAGYYQLGVVPPTDTKNLTFQDVNCLSVLQMLVDEFSIEFVFSDDGKTISFVEKIGNDTGLSFEFKNGLRNIERQKLNDKNIVTRLYAFGGERNIAKDYGSKKLKIDVIEQNTAIFGKIEGVANFDDIYPHREGAVTAVSAGNIYKFSDSTLDFNVNDQLIAGIVAKVTFNTGYLAGYELEISAFDDATKTFSLIPYQDSNGLEFPNDTLVIQNGDTYIVHDITMPEIYVTNAEAKLQTRAEEYLEENSVPNVTYAIVPDHVYLRKNLISLNIGDVIEVKDSDLNVVFDTRILEVTQSLANPYLYSIVVGNQLKVGYITRVKNNLTDLDNNLRIEREDRTVQYNRIRRNLRNIDELKDSIFDTDGYFDTDNIKPLSIETGMLSVGSKGQQFIIRNLLIQANYEGNSDVIKIGDGVLAHFTIDENTVKEWNLSGYTLTLGAPSVFYYIYAKCSKSTNTGVFELSETQYQTNAENHYYFLIGVLHSVVDGVRGISLTYGQTTINGKFVTTGKVQSVDGNNYFDLDNNQLKIGNGSAGLDWNVTNPDKLTIRGGVVQSPAGEEFPITVFRGVFVASKTYFKGDQVTYSGSTYTYINNIGSSETPENRSYWGITAIKGTDGTGVSIKGSVVTASSLDMSYTGEIGDMYISQDNGHGHVWDGTSWDDVGRIKGDTGDTGATGEKGDQGDQGKGVSSTLVEYKVSVSGDTPPSGTWSLSVPTVESNQYLWTRTTINYTEGSPTVAYSIGKIGAVGSAGKGISSTVVTYQASASGTTTPTGVWLSTIPSVAPNSFLWTRVVTTYTDSESTTAYSIGKMGAQGAEGAKGETGEKGSPGTGIATYTEQYYLSTSKTSQTGGSWIDDTAPTWEQGKFMWSRVQIVYNNPASTQHTTPIVSDSWTAIDNLQIGGRNLLRNSDFSQGLDYINSRNASIYNLSIDETETYLGYVSLKMEGNEGGSNNSGDVSIVTTKDSVINSPYVFSFYAKSDAENTFQARWGYHTGASQQVQISTDWKQYTIDVIGGSQSFGSILIMLIESGTIWIVNPKLETGNKATDWTPAPEDSGKNITATEIEFYLSTSSTATAGGTWTDIAPPHEDGKYMFMRTHITHADGTESYSPNINGVNITGAKGTDGLPGKDGVGVETTVINYALSTSGTNAPTTGWTAAVPTLTKGNYLWTRTLWTYTDDSTETGHSVSYIPTDGSNGTDGLPGKDGVGITNTAITYAKSSSGTSAPTTGWVAQPPATIPGDFIWTKTVWTYSDSSTETGYAVGKIGNTGATGDRGPQGVQGQTGPQGQATYTWIRYADTSTGGGINNLPTGKKYIGFAYNKTTQTETNTPGDYTWSLIQGPKGDTGDTGNQGVPGTPGADGTERWTWIKYSDNANGSGMYDIPTASTKYIGIAVNQTTQTEGSNTGSYTWSKYVGDDGQDGATGTGIATYTEQYYLSTSKTSQTGGSWIDDTAPAWEPGKFMWSRVKIVYNNPTSTQQTTPIVSDSWTAIDNLQIGGRNFIKNSKKNYSYLGYGELYNADLAVPLVQGETYVFSQKVNTIEGQLTYSVMLPGFNSRQTFTPNIPFVASSNQTILLIHSEGNATGLNFDIYELKLEKGNKATDWTPAPEDSGKNITATEIEFYLSTSSVATSGGFWTNIAPPHEDGKFMFIRTHITHADGTESYSPDVNGVNITGAKGSPGAGIVFRGEFLNTDLYYNNSVRRDVVKYGGDYYLYKGINGVALNWSASNWETFGAQFESVATNTLLAENANIADWIIKDGKITSQTEYDGTPRAQFDGVNGEITLVSPKTIYTSTGGERTYKHTLEIDSNEGRVSASHTGDSFQSSGVSYLDSEGVFASFAGMPASGAATGSIIKGSVVGLGEGKLSKSAYSNNNALVGVFGSASNSAINPAPAFGGYFLGLYATGLHLNVRKVTASTTLTYSDVIIHCYQTSPITITLEPDPNIGKRVEITNVNNISCTVSGGSRQLNIRGVRSSLDIDYSVTVVLTWDGDYWVGTPRVS